DLHVALDRPHGSAHGLGGGGNLDRVALPVVRLDVAQHEEAVDRAHRDESRVDGAVQDLAHRAAAVDEGQDVVDDVDVPAELVDLDLEGELREAHVVVAEDLADHKELVRAAGGLEDQARHVGVEGHTGQGVALLLFRRSALRELEGRLLPHEHVEDLFLDLLAQALLDVPLLDEAALDRDLAELPAQELLLLEERVQVLLRDALAPEEDLAQLVDSLHRGGEQAHALRAEVDGLAVRVPAQREEPLPVIHRQELQQVPQAEDLDVALQNSHLSAEPPGGRKSSSPHLDFGHPPDGLGVGLALRPEDPLGQRLGRVAGEDRDALLQQDGALVVVQVGQVDRAAGLPGAGAEDRLVHAVPVHALAAEVREQGRVDVEDPPLELAGEEVAADEARHDHQVD